MVVGVERYEAGPSWALDGPARDAVSFTRWLLDHGVPPQQITLFLSPLNDSDLETLPGGIEARGAERELINQFLTRVLPTVRGDLFWLFWAGHGVLTRDDSRRLFYADACQEDKRNLDLTSLLTSLRSDLYAGLPRQVAVVDACQNHVERLQLAATLPGETFSYGLPLPRLEQFVLYAASPGQVAVNMATSRTGAFSAALMEELASEPIAAWPPDLEGLVRRVASHFQSPGKVKQRPSVLRYRTWTGEEHHFVDARAAKRPTRGARGRPSVAAVDGLVNQLIEIDAVADPVSRAAVIGGLNTSLARSIRFSPLDRVHLVNTVMRCTEWPGGLGELMGMVSLYGNPHDPAVRSAVDAAYRLAREIGEDLE
jgi:hypothetical protein